MNIPDLVHLQVRFAACVAARAFMQALGPARELQYPALLPHLCFNRYDIAEGVRSYSNETWQLVMGSEGLDWVARCIKQVIPHVRLCCLDLEFQSPSPVWNKGVR